MMKAYTFTAAVNAYTLHKAAGALGVKVFTTEENTLFPIPQQTPNSEQDWLLFTEEHSLAQALRGKLKGRFLPEKFPIHLLDDKWAFADWLASSETLTSGLEQWQVDSNTAPAFPCLLKAKRSWQDGHKLPRGWVCYNEQDVQQHLSDIIRRGLSSEDFFFQEWLGNQDHHNISVCGFHDSRDPARNLTAIVRRLLSSHQQELSCAAAVETVHDQWDLQAKTRSILDALDFVGPYELEFIITKNRVRVLELNPRFWMQHALFLKTGNGLLKRYFGLDSATDQHPALLKNITWMDSLCFTRAWFTRHWQLPGLYFKKRFIDKHRIILYPPVHTTFFILAKRFFSKCWSR